METPGGGGYGVPDVPSSTTSTKNPVAMPTHGSVNAYKMMQESA